jgi:valyl-tRNA synthetase
MRAAYPKAEDFPADSAALAAVATLQEVIVTVRRVRAESGISPRVPLRVVSAPALVAAVEGHADALRNLAAVTLEAGPKPGMALATVAAGHDLYVVVEGVLDVARERERLGKEIEKARKSVAHYQSRLGNEAFVSKAPEKLLAETRAGLAADEDKLARLVAALTALGA